MIHRLPIEIQDLIHDYTILPKEVCSYDVTINEDYSEFPYSDWLIVKISYKNLSLKIKCSGINWIYDTLRFQRTYHRPDTILSLTNNNIIEYDNLRYTIDAEDRDTLLDLFKNGGKTWNVLLKDINSV